MSCLAFAEDLALLAETEEEAISQINTPKEIAEKAGLQISYEKNRIYVNREKLLQKKIIETKYGKIKVTR